MQFPTSSAPFLPGPNTVSALMRRVILALVPGIIAMTAYFGWGVVFNLLLATLTCVAAEAAMLKLRNRPIAPAQGTGLQDGSAILTGLLLGLALPPLVAWWIPVIGALFAIVMAKHLYGGLGYNPFNPAMVGYVVLLISFPKDMTQWLAIADPTVVQPGLIQALNYVFKWSADIESLGLDAITQATPLDYLKTEIGLSNTVEEIRSHAMFSGLSGVGWQWVNLAFLAGGGWMIWRGDIDWRIPAGMLGALIVLSLVFAGLDGDQYEGPLFNLFSGATMLGAFFIATDPVSAATTPRGRIYYGIGIGVLVYVIRAWGGYPDGVAFSVLLMNIVAPTLDYYTQPRAYGEGKDGDAE